MRGPPERIMWQARKHRLWTDSCTKCRASIHRQFIIGKTRPVQAQSSQGRLPTRSLELSNLPNPFSALRPWSLFSLLEKWVSGIIRRGNKRGRRVRLIISRPSVGRLTRSYKEEPRILVNCYCLLRRFCYFTSYVRDSTLQELNTRNTKRVQLLHTK